MRPKTKTFAILYLVVSKSFVLFIVLLNRVKDCREEVFLFLDFKTLITFGRIELKLLSKKMCT